MNRGQQAVVTVHAVFVLFLFVLAAWIALVLGENDPDDDWMISARMVFWPIAAIVIAIAFGVASATGHWARKGSRGPLFVADMAIPALALMFAGPFIVDPSFMGDLPGLAGSVAIALVCGGFVAAVRPPARETATLRP